MIDLEDFVYDLDSETYRVEYDPGSTPASMAVVGSLVEVLEVAPTDIEPLYRAVDTDAVDRLLADDRPNGARVRLTFVVEGATVTASSEGFLTVAPPEDATPRDHGGSES